MMAPLLSLRPYNLITVPISEIESIAQLPIASVLDEVKQRLAENHQLVLEAPPGAGKTTAVPLALLDCAWRHGKKILLLEPRRLAARAAAERMAELLAEAVGSSVGYRVRLDSCVSDDTVIEVVTEGILTRRLQNDPALEDVALVIFDEFHERSLDTDLGLALCLQARSLFRDPDDPLKLLVMSATLDGGSVSQLLGDAAIVRSQGRQFPVTIHYGSTAAANSDVISATGDCIQRALDETHGNILVFLPGQAEINRIAAELNESRAVKDASLRVYPLYGSLSLTEQRQAIAATADNKRKIVLATNIAETSLTIEGISTVIDTGLVREPRFDPRCGMTRMATTRISRASSEQRAGRAGRLEAGHCYRLWSEEQQQQLAAHTTPEILQADLTPLALSLVQWGIDNPAELSWMDGPPQAAYQQALDLLHDLNVIHKSEAQHWQLTAHGARVAQLPTHPRLAHMLVRAKAMGLEIIACQLAAILSERDPFSGTANSQHPATDLRYRLAVIRGEITCEKRHRAWQQRVITLSKQFRSLCRSIKPEAIVVESLSEDDASALLLAFAYPDRIAQMRKNKQNDYLLSSGRSATLRDDDALCGSTFLVVAELGGRHGDSRDRIYSAVPLAQQLLESHLQEMGDTRTKVAWDTREEKFVAECQTLIGAIILKRTRLDNVPPEAKLEALKTVIEKRGLNLLPWDEHLRQWQARVELLYEHDDSETWPDLSDAALLKSIDLWLLPYLHKVNRLEDFAQIDLKSLLVNLLSWPQQQRLDELAPERIKVPSGSMIKIDYLQSPPVLAVKLQEMFGCESSPQILNGKVTLLVHLLSPAQRPLQVTQDLAGFWRNSYQEVKKEMKGRYPKHPWPDDPLQALATRSTKRKLTDH